MADHDALGAAREEAARESVWLVTMAIAIPLLAYIERKATSPDAWRETKMRAALAAERFCMESARNWAHLADRARSWYERERA